MTDDRELLASAYLDDEVTADERAVVEADPELVAAVERLHAVRRRLAVSEPAPISVREEQIAAALAAWDRLPEAERLGLHATERDARPRRSREPDRATRARRRAWPLGAAAAVLLVVGAGVALQQIDPTDNQDRIAEPADDSGDPGSSPDAPVDASADAPAAQPTGGDATPGASSPSPVGTDAAAGESELGESEPAEDLTARDIELESRTLEVIEEESGDDLTHSAEPPDDGPPSDASTTDLPVLEDNQDLASFAAQAVDAPVSAEGPLEDDVDTQADDTGTGDVTVGDVRADESESLPSLPDCSALGVDVVVGLAVFRDDIVMVGWDRDLDFAIAYDPQLCTVVESIPAGG